ncbi:MAG: CHASE3 domain-containing protein [Gammaproteobacteria bacterium]
MGAGATVAAIAAVIALGFMERRSIRDIRESAGWVAHTHQVQRELELARSLLVDAETGQRGYLLTDDEAYLAPNEQATAALPGALARLRQLVADDSVQQQTLAEIERLAGERLQIIRETVAAAKGGQRERAIETVSDGRGKRLMEALRAQIQRAVGVEEGLLRQRQARLTNSIARRGTEAQILLLGMLAGLIAGAFLLVRLNRAMTVVSICLGPKIIEHGGESLTVDQYLHQRFDVDIAHGLTPGEYARVMSGK